MTTSRFTTEEIKRKYEERAREYALFERLQEPLGLARLRRRLLRRASGDVLEVAVGTGANLPHYPRGCHITAVDASPAMLRMAEERAVSLGLDVALRAADAETLRFPDASFDTVVSTLSLCTFPNPVAALGEMERVRRPDGRILLLEHGRSNVGWLGRLQDRREETHAEQLGCHWNREPLDLLHRAGLRPISARRTFLGIFHEVEVGPSA